MTGSAATFRQKLERLKGGREQVTRSLAKAEDALTDAKLQSIYCEEATTIIQNVAQATQQELEYHISELVALAQASVFDDPYGFKTEFVLRRNRTEADLWFMKGEHKIHPLNASEGGAVDLASFALRVSTWRLAPRRSRPVLFMDEPLKWLKGDDLPIRGAATIKEVSARMKLQIIMISHITEQVESADRKIHVTMNNRVSQVKIE